MSVEGLICGSCIAGPVNPFTINFFKKKLIIQSILNLFEIYQNLLMKPVCTQGHVQFSV